MTETIASDDRGLLLGDGLFETVLAAGGRPVLFEAHLARLTRGCAVLGLPAPDPGVVADAVTQALDQAGLAKARAAVRVTWTAGSGGRGLDRPEPPAPRLIVTAAPSAPPTAPARLITARARRNDQSPASRLKTLSYLDNVLTRSEARAAGADEALMLNTRGHLACAAAANLFWIEGEALATPALSCGVLDGVLRGALIERALGAGIVVREVEVGPDALVSAQGLFITNSLIGLRPVSWLDGRPYDVPPLIGRLQALCADLKG
ncbi:MAG: aminotransferase class IV [Caulobacteraceae bacterium]|nr:aminotransferase class IV [Caulobacteraceae bacterium]